MNYGKALKIARAVAGLTQRKVAAMANLDPSHISLIESGRRNPSIATVEKLCRALSVPNHLFTLLASEPADLNIADPQELARISESLTRLLLRHVVKSKPPRSRSSSGTRD